MKNTDLEITFKCVFESPEEKINSTNISHSWFHYNYNSQYNFVFIGLKDGV